jgi:uncharacterized spore protein YtfJ
MIETRNKAFSFIGQMSEQLPSVIERIFAAARSNSVYSEPVVSGNYTVITASEVTSGGGFGSGIGLGPKTSPSQKEQTDGQGSQAEQGEGGGGGIGGGGGAMGRPVAVIIIGPEGVTVKPVIDPTRIALAGIAAWITLFSMFSRARRAGRR